MIVGEKRNFRFHRDRNKARMPIRLGLENSKDSISMGQRGMNVNGKRLFGPLEVGNPFSVGLPAEVL